jgi:hypothetical protein
MTDKLEVFRRMLDRENWPEFDLIMNGELYRYVTDDPLEERVYKVLLPLAPTLKFLRGDTGKP